MKETLHITHANGDIRVHIKRTSGKRTYKLSSSKLQRVLGVIQNVPCYVMAYANGYSIFTTFDKIENNRPHINPKKL
jgi:hypothetical protein